MKVTLALQGDTLSYAADIDGHAYLTDSCAAFGGQGLGPTPMQNVLAALGSCSAMDVVAMLRKMKQPVTALEVDVAGEQRTQHPRIFEHITVTMRIEGDVAPRRAWKAVRLSRDNYCPVHAMLRPAVDVRFQVVINGESFDEPG